MWRAPNAQHLVRSGSNHAHDKPKMTTGHHVFSIGRHSDQLVMPPAVQYVKKLDDHVEHVLSSVAFKHGDNDQMEVHEITVVTSAQA